MRIAVYTTTDDVPESLRAVAQFVVGGKFTPVYVNGRNPAEAREKAQAFWTKHSEDIQRGRVPKTKKPGATEEIRTAEAVYDQPQTTLTRTAEAVYDPLDDL